DAVRALPADAMEVRVGLRHCGSVGAMFLTIRNSARYSSSRRHSGAARALCGQNPEPSALGMLFATAAEALGSGSPLRGVRNDEGERRVEAAGPLESASLR